MVIEKFIHKEGTTTNMSRSR